MNTTIETAANLLAQQSNSPFYFSAIMMASFLLFGVLFSSFEASGKRALFSLSIFAVLGVAASFFGGRLMASAVQESAFYQASLLLSPTAEMNVVVNSNGTRSLNIVQPEVVEETETTVLGKQVRETIVKKPRQSTSLTQSQIDILAKAEIRLASGQQLTEIMLVGNQNSNNN